MNSLYHTSQFLVPKITDFLFSCAFSHFQRGENFFFGKLSNIFSQTYHFSDVLAALFWKSNANHPKLPWFQVKSPRKPRICPFCRKILQSLINFDTPPPDYMFYVFKLVTIWFIEFLIHQDFIYERMTI